MSTGTANARVADFEPFFADGLLTEDVLDTGAPQMAMVSPLGSSLKYHVFLSHRQIEAGDACNLMADKLRYRGLRVWFDQEREGSLTEAEMRRRIQDSKCFLLFLSKTVFGSAAVRMELSTALEMEKPILLVHESETGRPGFANFSTYIDSAPPNAADLFATVESMPFQGRLYLAKGFYEKLTARIEHAG